MPAAPTTTKIMIIRHAEKPPASGEPFGVTADGDRDAESLISLPRPQETPGSKRSRGLWLRH